ncbi:hydrogenase iron-sulfur subunit [uncultured Desulfosarcina sp.]|uniref:hydrogenase iron-sulfur subunit n=1 Tax=uncultured Desulfosarcina sp. TaxID=218289 RepID=UPI0029C92431|nr:hydrogenase iron-sulfur subunit [uncultured Desulfosarcina sp.]
MTTCAPEKTTQDREGDVAAPKILVFSCRWCAGIGADDAGRQRLPMPPGFRCVSMECAAGIDPDIVLKAFSAGAEGVAVLGCHLDGCRYNQANHSAAKRMEMLATLLETVGIGADRLLTSFGTAHEGHQFAELMRRFSLKIAAMPSLTRRDSADATGGCADDD